MIDLNLSIKSEKKKYQSSLYNPWKVKSILDKTRDDIFLKNGTIKDDIEDFFKKYGSCSTVEIYAHNKDDIKKVHSNRCSNHKLCPNCSNQIQSKRKKEIIPYFESCIENDCNFYFMTFTMISDSDPYRMISKIQKSFRQWVKRGSKKNSTYQSSKIKAAIKNLEITKGKDKKSDNWHVHLHVILITDKNDTIDYSVYDYDKAKKVKKRLKKKFLSIDELKEHCPKDKIEYLGKPVYLSKLTREWYTITGGSFNVSVVNMKTYYKKKRKELMSKYGISSYTDYVKKTSVELLKYQMKPNSVPSHYFDILFDCLKNVRTFETYGDLNNRGASKAEEKKKTIPDFRGYDITSCTYSHGKQSFFNKELDQQSRNQFTKNYPRYLELKGEMGKIICHYQQKIRKLVKLREKYLLFFDRMISIKRKIKIRMKFRCQVIYNKMMVLLFDKDPLSHIWKEKPWIKGFEIGKQQELVLT